MEFGALRTKVARRMLGLFVLCALVPIGTLAVVMYQRMSRLVAAQARERLEQASKAAALDVFRRLQDVDAQLRAATPEVVTWRPGPRGAPANLDQMLARLVLRRGGGSAPPVFVVGSADSLPPPLPGDAENHLTSGRPVLVPAAERLWLVRSAAPWEPRSLLWAELGPTLWDSAGTGGALDPEMSLCVLYRSGQPLHCPAIGDGYPLSGVVADRGTAGFVEFDGRNGPQLGAWWALFLRYQLFADDLIVFVSQPRAVALAAMADFRWTFVPAVLLALWLVLLLVYVQVRRTTAPLSELRSATQRVSALDFTRPVEIRSGDEFEDVAGSFNTMATTLQTQFAERDRLTTAVQRTSEALRESEQRLRAILETAPDGVVTADARGIIEEFNRTAEQLFGYRREEVIGRPVSILLADEPVAGAAFHSGERRARRKDESVFPVELGVSEARVGAGTVTTGFVHDITERRRREDEQAKLEAQVRHTQKMDTIGTLAGGIAHDFNNILTGVMGYLDLALDDLPPDAPARPDLLEVRAAAERAKALVRQILVFSRKAESRLQPVDLAGVVTEARALLRASIPATIDIRVGVHPRTPIVHADPTQLHQVIMNLGTNAYHAMRQAGGTLEIDLRPVTLPSPGDPGLVDVALPPGPYACLSVRDTGHGMDAATLERIFEPFFTTKPVGEGTGLGLSVVHGIITRLGGTIAVESTPGAGTAFRILLPQGEGVEKDAATTPAAWADMRGSANILVVDDDVAIATMIKRILDRLGYTTTVAANSRDAYEAVRTNPARFDLVISDLTMPGLTGDKLGAALAALRPDLRLLLVTGQADAVTADSYRAWGFHAQVSKPLGARALGEVVQQVLRTTAARSDG